MRPSFYQRHKFVLTTTLISLAMIVLVLCYYPVHCKTSSQTIVYPARAQPYQFYRQLKQQGCQVPGVIFRVNAHLWQARHWQAGEYVLQSGDSIAKLMYALRMGHAKQHAFTIAPGATYQSLKERFKEKHWRLDGEDCHGEACFYTILPDTYNYTRFDQNAGKTLLKSAQAHFKAQVARAWAQRDPQATPWKTIEEAVIVASLLEQETADFNERRLIAGVIINRLKLGMPLQIDASVKVALIEAHQWEGRLTQSNYAIKNNINTYKNKGLPPRPIGVASLSAIQSALNPIQSDYLYYRILPGRHYHTFTKTFLEHRKLKE